MYQSQSQIQKLTYREHPMESFSLAQCPTLFTTVSNVGLETMLDTHYHVLFQPNLAGAHEHCS
jgi:hypothetical protein